MCVPLGGDGSGAPFDLDVYNEEMRKILGPNGTRSTKEQTEEAKRRARIRYNGGSSPNIPAVTPPPTKSPIFGPALPRDKVGASALKLPRR